VRRQGLALLETHSKGLIWDEGGGFVEQMIEVERKGVAKPVLPSIAGSVTTPPAVAARLSHSPPQKVSSQLLDNSIAAAIAAIEIYNKPVFNYREQVFTILIINAWELLLKARILADAGEKLEALYVLRDGKPKLNRNDQPMTIEILGAIKRLSLDATLVANLEVLVETRDTAIHFYHSDSLSYLVYTLGVAALRNYQKLVSTWFGRSLLEFNFYILPLAFAYNFQTLAILECDREPEVIAKLLKSVAQTQAKVDTGAYQFVCEIATELRSAKKFVDDSSDVRVAVDKDCGQAVVYRTQTLTDRYPLSYFEVVAKIRSAIPGVKQQEIDDAIKKLKLKGTPAYAAYNYRTKAQEEQARKTGIPKGLVCIYNEDAVRLLIETLKSRS
jgi:hypothetical protein